MDMLKKIAMLEALIWKKIKYGKIEESTSSRDWCSIYIYS
jgi:hypothetical protein